MQFVVSWLKIIVMFLLKNKFVIFFCIFLSLLKVLKTKFFTNKILIKINKYQYKFILYFI